MAADIKAAADDALEVRREQDHFVQEWLESVGEGVPGYVTPKVAVGAIVGNDEGELLLVQRADSGIWLYPTGWADVGYSPAEVGAQGGAGGDRRRVRAGAAPGRHRRPADGLHPLRHVHGAVPLPGRRRRAAGPSAGDERRRLVRLRTSCPRATGGAAWWGPMAFAAISGERMAATFDPPRPTCGGARPDAQLLPWSRRKRSMSSSIWSVSAPGRARPRARRRRLLGRRPRSSPISSSRLDVARQLLVLLQVAVDLASYSSTARCQRLTRARAMPMTRQAPSPRANAALGEGTCEAYAGTAAHSDSDSTRGPGRCRAAPRRCPSGPRSGCVAGRSSR